MSSLKKLFGLGLASMLDAGTGMIMTQVIGWLLHWHIAWYNYLVGIIFAMLPDVDMIFQYIQEFSGGDESDSSHKALPTHYPPVMIPTVSILTWIACALLSVSTNYALLAILCLLAHYFHDSWQSQENGPGVRWLAPFKKEYYQLFSKHARGGSIKLFLVVSPERVERTFQETLEEWLNSIFFRFTWENAIGIAIFTVAVAVAMHNLLW